ncbi:MAG TPA: hypothetical protein VFB08_11895 [Burkholderiales bacterium]|nr:hypothetical protein [Burkholderiales bacterium]
MKTSTALLAVLALGTASAWADTRSSEHDRTTMERRASPSNPAKQDEEQAEAHGQPDSNTAGNSASGASSGEDAKAKDPQKKPTSGDYYQSNENKADSTKDAPK